MIVRWGFTFFVGLFFFSSFDSWSAEHISPKKQGFEQLVGATYFPTALDGEESVTLKRGAYSFRREDGTKQVFSTVLSLWDVGKLKKLSPMYKVAILVTNTGGSGSFVDLMLMDHSSPAKQVDCVFLGDRTQVKSVMIRNYRVEVEMVRHGKGDSMCCPSERVLNTYRLKKGVLELVESVALDEPKPEAASTEGK